MFYSLNGIPIDKLIDKTEFWIIESNNDYIIKENDISSDLDFEFINLRMLIADLIFGSRKKYYDILSFVPQWIPYAGIDSELKISKEHFEKLVAKIDDENTFKLLYYYDIDYLIGTIQNSIQESRNLFCEFYKEFNINNFMLAEKPFNENSVMFASGRLVTSVFSKINQLFISLYSQLDFITKLAFEIENFQTEFTKYTKLKSSNLLFGNNKKLTYSDSEKTSTLFEKSARNIQIIQTLRNEIVHNASLQNIQKIYQVFNNDKLIEKFILIPDFDKNGNIKSFKNRKRFFDSDIKLNQILPDLLSDFWIREMKTIELIKNSCQQKI